MSFMLTDGRFKAFANDGTALVGGKLFTYASGTTTNKATYTAATLSTANTNPVILDSRGEAQVWLAEGAYTFVLKTSADVTIWTVDGVQRETDAVATLEADLAVDDDETKGAGMVGFDYREPYALNTTGWGIKETPGLVNALLKIDPAEHAAIKAGTSTYDAATEIQSALTGNAVILPGGVYKVGSKLTLGYSLTGSGMESSQLVATANTFDILEIGDSVDFVKVEDLRLEFPSNGTGRGLVLKNINNDVVINRVAVQRGAVGIDVVNVAFRQRFQDCRIDYCPIGYQAEGRTAALTGAGTTVTYDRCYVSNGVQTGWNLSNIRSVDFLQPAADISGWGSGIVCTGVGHLNILGGHFEGTPGSDGEYIRYSTSGSLSHGIAITGLCIEGPDFTGRTFRLLNIQANDDHVRVDLTHVNFRGITGTTTNAYIAKISGGASSRVTIICNGCDFGALAGKFDLTSMSGKFNVRYIDEEPHIIAAGSASVNASTGAGVIATGVDFSDPPKVVFVQHRRDDGVLPTVEAHVTQTYSGSGDVQIKFRNYATGLADTGTYNVDWQVIAQP